MALFGLLGACSVALGLMAVAGAKSDIQLQIAATLIVGGILLFGVAVVLFQIGRLRSLIAKEARPLMDRDARERDPLGVRF